MSEGVGPPLPGTAGHAAVPSSSLVVSIIELAWPYDVQSAPTIRPVESAPMVTSYMWDGP